MSRALRHRTGILPKDTRALRHGAGKTGEIGESVDVHLRTARVRIRGDFRTAILAIMNAAPSSDDSEAGLYASDIVDEVLGALLDFTDCDTVAECILKNESLATDLHELMTGDIQVHRRGRYSVAPPLFGDRQMGTTAFVIVATTGLVVLVAGTLLAKYLHEKANQEIKAIGARMKANLHRQRKD